jgi:hypothetical protein
MMTVHVLHAGDGYTYLTRRVASGDQGRLRGDTLTDHYTGDGNPPGRWMGSACAALDVKAQVIEDQMKALFGAGLHPNAARFIEEAVARGVPHEEALAAARLGRRFPTMQRSDEVWRARLAGAFKEFEIVHGHRPERGPERDLVRLNVANGLFHETHQRAPRADSELKAFFTRASKPRGER